MGQSTAARHQNAAHPLARAWSEREARVDRARYTDAKPPVTWALMNSVVRVNHLTLE